VRKVESKGPRRATRWTIAAGLVAIALTAAACGSSSSSSSSASGGGASSSASASATTSASGGGSKSPLVFTQLEGNVAEGSADFAKGVAIAVNQINAAGGVDGHPIQLNTIQSGLTTDSTVSAYRAATSDSKNVVAYLEGTTGVDAVAAQAPRAQLPIMQQAGNAALVDPAKPYVYSMSFDTGYPDSVVRYAVQNFHTKKIAILHFTDDYSSGITASITQRCKQLGCQVVDSETGDPTASVDGITPELEKMKNSGADTYYIETLNPNAAKAARQLGMFNKPVISEQWLSVPAIAAATGAAGENITFAAQTCLDPSLASKSDPVQALCKAYIAAFKKAYPGQPYALFSIYGHDAVEVFAQAAKELIAAGKPVTRANMEQQLQSFHGELTTSQGTINTSSAQHHLTGSFGSGGYLLYNMKVNGKNITYVLAPHADPAGAQP
jgi:branched-chain amino acid transport system substrate-binding protein